MKNLTNELLSNLFPKAGSRKYARNQIICYQGDKPQHAFFVLRGHIKYYDIDDRGNEKILHIIGPQNIFPMLYAFGVSPDTGAFYSSIDKVEVMTIPIVEFRRAFETNIEFSNSLTRWFLTEIEQLVYRINSLEKTDSRLKVLHALKYLALNYGHVEKEWYQINFTTTQQFLADFSGLTRETVAVSMAELEKDKTTRCVSGRLLEIRKSEVSKQ